MITGAASSGRRCVGRLAAVLGGVHVALHDAHVLPVDVEFLGDQHRQRGLDALADLGVLGGDGDLAVVDRAFAPSAGAFVIALVEGDFTLKELRYQGQRPILIPHNEDFEPIQPAGQMEVFGVVRGIVRKIKGSLAGSPQYTQLGGTKT